MHGNVWEWCNDVWKEGATQRVHRGGSYRYDSDFSRAAHRGGHPPSYQNNDHGLRLARVPVGVRTESGANNKPAQTAIDPLTDADIKRVPALPAAKRVEAVSAEVESPQPRLRRPGRMSRHLVRF
jgi:hypothetical protein